eukprot:3313568-Prymnesium_polylepis.1
MHLHLLSPTRGRACAPPTAPNDLRSSSRAGSAMTSRRPRHMRCGASSRWPRPAGHSPEPSPCTVPSSRVCSHMHAGAPQPPV